MSKSPVIAVVDDDAAMREALFELFQVLDLPCRTFDGADAFLAAYAPGSFDCLITDIRMPGMSGLELQQTLKARGYKVPIIFITAYGNAEIRLEAMGEGAIAFLTKPFDDEALLDSVRAVLKTRRSLP